MTDRPKAALAMDPKLAAEVFPDDVVASLKRIVDFDHEVVASFAEADIADVDIMLTGWGCPFIDEDVLDVAPRLRAIIHAAGTIKNHVGADVFARGLAVSAATEVNARPVADFTVSVLVLAAKQVFTHARRYATGQPQMNPPIDEDAGLTGTTVGIIGASRVGRMVIDRLGDFDVRVLVSDPYLNASEATERGAELVDLDELMRWSDYVSVHAPALPETYRMLAGPQLAMLRDGGVVINTARGSLIDTDALARECLTGRLSAVLDVTDPEPLPPGHPLVSLPNVFLTPHLAGSRGRELPNLGRFAAEETARFVRGEPLRGAVQAPDLTRIA